MQVKARNHSVAIERDIVAQARGELRVGLDPVKRAVERRWNRAFMDQAGDVALDT
jgi:hypothetical protein